MPTRTNRQVRNADLRHAVELSVEAAAARAAASDGAFQFLCECERDDCDAFVRLTARQYRSLEFARGRHLVLQGHWSPQRERPLYVADGFVLVESVREARRRAEPEPRPPSLR